MSKVAKALMKSCWDDRLLFDRDLFAELIVRECINVIMSCNDRYRKEHFANLLKEHFEIVDNSTTISNDYVSI